MQPSTSQPIKTQPLIPNIRNIPTPNEGQIPHPTSTNDSTLPNTTTSQYVDVSQFTFLPDIYLIISRLAPLRNTLSEPNTNGTNTSTTTATATATAIAPTTSSSSQQQPSQQVPEGLSQTVSRESQHSGSGSSLRHISSSEASIEIKDLPAHVYAVKQAIARAKETVAGLSDIERSVDVQEAEIGALKRRIAGLKGRLEELAGLAAG